MSIPYKTMILSKLLIITICAVVILLTYFNVDVFMSLEPYTPFHYELDGFQFIVPGTISFALFLLLLLFVKLVGKWIYLPANTGRIILFLAFTGAIPTWVDFSAFANFCYGVIYGIVAIGPVLYLLILIFKHNNFVSE